MENFSRNAVALAIVGILRAATVPGTTQAAFKYVTRRKLHWDRIGQDKRPAVVVIEPTDHFGDPAVDVLTMLTLDFHFMVIADTKANAEVDDKPAISVVNDLVDAIQAAFRPPGMTGNQTLGGLVQSAWLDGDVNKDGGETDGIGVALLVLKVLVPA